MRFNFIKKLPTPKELKEIYPINKSLYNLKLNRDREIENIFLGLDKRFIVIVGPCSAHDRDSVLDYCVRLSKIQDKLTSKLLIIPRIYTNKPRTNGSGYKGLLHQPDPNKEPNMLDGIIAIRNLHLDVLEYSGLSTADEMLYPENHRYINDILSYVAVGARSVENQFHRLAASGVGIACGMKNPTFGDFNTLINSVYAAQNPHTFIYRGWEVTTDGNELAHCILRGYTDRSGRNIPNYHLNDVLNLYKINMNNNIKNPSVIIDLNHSNSNKDYKKQIDIAYNILDYRKNDITLQKFIKGFMIESFIVEGCQPVNGEIYGKSITDPCLGIEDTENLLNYIAENI